MNDDVIIVNGKVLYETNKSVKYLIYMGVKRTFDVIVALIGLLFLLPIIVVVKIVTLASKDKNSIFYTQYRVGKRGKLFKLYKFRSMVMNADMILFDYLKQNEEAAYEYKINKKLKNDPRITKIGKFLRKTSLDELPQIINILKGDMSFIGNRPYLPREIDDMGLYYYEIIKTTPGLTGYWQVSGRSDTLFKKRLELEKYYSNNASLKMDLKIFFKTFKVVFKCMGAK